MTYSPGPWSYRDRIIRDMAHCHVCEMLGSKSNPYHIADARLIAAAPEIYECLKLAMADIGADACPSTCTSPWHGRALAAIAKAEGK